MEEKLNTYAANMHRLKHILYSAANMQLCTVYIYLYRITYWYRIRMHGRVDILGIRTDSLHPAWRKVS